MTFKEQIRAAQATILAAATRLELAYKDAPDSSAKEYVYHINKKLIELASNSERLSLELLLDHLE